MENNLHWWIQASLSNSQPLRLNQRTAWRMLPVEFTDVLCQSENWTSVFKIRLEALFIWWGPCEFVSNATGTSFERSKNKASYNPSDTRSCWKATMSSDERCLMSQSESGRIYKNNRQYDHQLNSPALEVSYFLSRKKKRKLASRWSPLLNSYSREVVSCSHAFNFFIYSQNIKWNGTLSLIK